MVEPQELDGESSQGILPNVQQRKSQWQDKIQNKIHQVDLCNKVQQKIMNINLLHPTPVLPSTSFVSLLQTDRFRDERILLQFRPIAPVANLQLLQMSHAYFLAPSIQPRLFCSIIIKSLKSLLNGDTKCWEPPAGPGESAEIGHSQQKDSHQYQPEPVYRRDFQGTLLSVCILYIFFITTPLSLYQTVRSCSDSSQSKPGLHRKLEDRRIVLIDGTQIIIESANEFV